MSDQIRLRKKKNFRDYFVVASSKTINLFLESVSDLQSDPPDSDRALHLSSGETVCSSSPIS